MFCHGSASPVPSLCPPTAGTTGPSHGLKRRAGCRRAGRRGTWCAPARPAAASTPSRSSECRDGQKTVGMAKKQSGCCPRGVPPWGDGENPHPWGDPSSSHQSPDPEGRHLPIQGGDPGVLVWSWGGGGGTACPPLPAHCWERQWRFLPEEVQPLEPKQSERGREQTGVDTAAGQAGAGGLAATLMPFDRPGPARAASTSSWPRPRTTSTRSARPAASLPASLKLCTTTPRRSCPSRGLSTWPCCTPSTASYISIC